MLGQQRVQRVAGGAARQPGHALADGGEVAVGELLELAVEFAGPPGLPGERGALGGGEPAADGQLGAVREQQLQLLDVVGGAPPGERVRAAGIVADHAADGAAAVRGRVRAEAQPVRPGGALEVVQDGAGADARGAGRRVDLQHLAEVAAEVQHHRARADRLPADAGPGAARHDRHPVPAAERQRGADVVRVGGLDHAERQLPVVGRVVAVDGPFGGAEADLPAQHGGQLTGQLGAGDGGRTAHQGPPGGGDEGRGPSSNSRLRGEDGPRAR